MNPRVSDQDAGLTWPTATAVRSYPPDSPARLVGRRVAALTAILVTVAYLVWRVGFTLHGATAWLAAWLLILEIHALVSLALHTIDLWDVSFVPPATAGLDVAEQPSVAVLVPTYNEPREILLPTIAAAVALRPAHQTWVLDDGARPWVADAARALGAHYRARTDRAHAKAGNINAVLPELDVDVVAVFDADHVAHADFLTHTLPYFADPAVALVQTPQEFYNPDSFEHVRTRRGHRFSEQQLFYRALAAGRNRWGAVFWCGTNAVLRLAAVREIGGVATDSITEDIQTTIRMHRRGWRSVYHNEVLANGLAAADIRQYLTQRLRWGVGAMQVLRTDNPAFGPGLRLAQRTSYLSTLVGWFESWRTLGYLLLPVATVLTGGLPVAAPLWAFLPWFVGVLVAQRLALRLLARGHATVWHSVLFEVIRLPASLLATLAIAGRRAQQRFVVTAKGRGGAVRTTMPVPRLLLTLLVAHVAGIAWYAATVLGSTPLHYRVPWTAHGAAAWLLLNAVILTCAIRRIRSPRYAVERRAAVRFEVRGPAVLDDRPVALRDVSLTGASVAVSGTPPRPGDHTTLTITGAGFELRLPGVVRGVSAYPDGTQVGIEFDRLPVPVAARLALVLFRTGITPSFEPVTVATAA
jgi:cellulose synthase (UDP-forming)